MLPAAADATPDVVGTYDLTATCTSYACSGASFSHTWNITAEDPSTGSFSGTGQNLTDGNSESFTGTIIGNSISATSSYTNRYVWYPSGTISADCSMTGSWSDNEGQSGTWQAKPTSGGCGQSSTPGTSGATGTPGSGTTASGSPAATGSGCGPAAPPLAAPLPTTCRYDLQVRLSAPRQISSVANRDVGGLSEVEWTIWMYVRNNGPVASPAAEVLLVPLWIDPHRGTKVFVHPPVQPVTTNAGDCTPRPTWPLTSDATCQINSLAPGAEARIRVTMFSFQDAVARFARRHEYLLLQLYAGAYQHKCDTNGEVSCSNNTTELRIPARTPRILRLLGQGTTGQRKR